MRVPARTPRVSFYHGTPVATLVRVLAAFALACALAWLPRRQANAKAAVENSALPGAEWKSMGERDGVRLFSRPESGSRVVTVRGETDFETPAAAVFDALKDMRNRTRWVPRLKEMRVLKELGPSARIELNVMDVPWPLADRYFVLRAEARVEAASGRIVIETVGSDEAVDDPALKGFVRGVAKRSLLVITPRGATASHLSIELNADPAGALPRWLVDRFQRNWPVEFLNGLRAELKRRGKGSSMK